MLFKYKKYKYDTKFLFAAASRGAMEGEEGEEGEKEASETKCMETLEEERDEDDMELDVLESAVIERGFSREKESSKSICRDEGCTQFFDGRRGRK